MSDRPTQVFISYRHKGGAELARLVYNALNERRYTAFMDLELGGGPFNTGLYAKIEEATDMVVILTHGSLEPCRKENDWMRLEIVHAFKHKKNVVPIMVSGFDWHNEGELPEDIAALHWQNGITPSHELFDASMDRLAQMLIAKPQRHFSALHIFASVFVVILSIAFWLLQPHLFGKQDNIKLNKFSNQEAIIQPSETVLPITTSNAQSQALEHKEIKPADEPQQKTKPVEELKVASEPPQEIVLVATPMQTPSAPVVNQPQDIPPAAQPEAIKKPQEVVVEEVIDVEKLIQQLKDRNLNVRSSAASALGKIKDIRAVKPLIALLKDEDLPVQKAAIYALGEIKDTRAVEPLTALLKDIDWNIRKEAACALGKIKDARAVEPLIALLKDEDWNVQKAAICALGETKDARAVKPLIALLKDLDGNVRSKAAFALGEIGDIRGVEPLTALLKDKSRDVRINSEEALNKIKAKNETKP